MLFIKFEGGQERTWHIGQKRPVGAMNKPVTEVQADGDELEYIRRHVSGIPMNDGRVVLWKAPFAQFVVDSLPAA